jgi:hypothetical protein
MSPTVAQLLEDHVTLSIESVDRLYINGYVPKLQVPGQLVRYMTERLDKPIPSPAILGDVTTRLVGDIKDFVAREDIPLIHFERGQRKDDVAAEQRSRYRARHGVVFVGVAQERAYAFKSSKRPGKIVSFDFSRQSVFVNHYYFYVHDREWGPAFLKLCTYAPYPVKICLNGHDWAKQQALRAGIAFESLDNGFLRTDDPEQLQQICDRLGPSDVLAFYHRWVEQLPWPIAADDRRAGYDHRLTIWQMEMSLTQVFERPVQGRLFFEQVIRNNLDLGCPDRVRLIFPTRLNRRTPPPAYGYRTRVITHGVNPSLHVEFKKSHVKQYFKEERALRTETTVNDPGDFHLTKGIENFDQLRKVGDDVNHKLLEVERLSADCALHVDEFEQLQRPTLHDGQRASAMRFGDPRVMALLHTLCLFFHLAAGLRNRDFRSRVAALLGLSLEQYSRGRATYDLRRLRLKGLIRRVPWTNRYEVTPLGRRVAYFHTTLYARILRPAWAAMTSTDDRLPRPLRAALRQVDEEVEKLCNSANLRDAA